MAASFELEMVDKEKVSRSQAAYEKALIQEKRLCDGAR
jgi:hypothetical protein